MRSNNAWRILIGACAALVLARAPAMGVTFSSTYQIDAAHDGNGAVAGNFAPPLTQVWSKQFSGTVSYPIVARGIVFITVTDAGDQNSQVYALNAKTGAVIWEKLVGYLSNLAYDQNKLFMVTQQGIMSAYNADRGGKLLWSLQLGGEFSFADPPTASGGLVYVTGSESGTMLYAIDESTGRIAWEQLGTGGTTAVSVGDGGVYVDDSCDIYKYDQKTGTLDWRDPCNTRSAIVLNPVYYGGKLYVPNEILDANTGSVLGTLSQQWSPAFRHPSSGDDQGFVESQGVLTAFDVRTGATAWTFTGDGEIEMAPIVVNDKVVIGSESGTIYLLDAGSGAQLWAGNAGAPVNNAANMTSGLSVGDGMLFVPATNVLSAWSASSAGSLTQTGR